jgi:hypothetical protein
LAECEFGGGADRRLVVRKGCPAVHVVSCETPTSFVFEPDFSVAPACRQTQTRRGRQDLSLRPHCRQILVHLRN